VKLADFDFAKYTSNSITPKNGPLIEKSFTAPELLDEPPSETTSASDIYSVGVLWYFLASLPRFDPNAKFPPDEAQAKIDALNLSEEARKLMKRMVAKSPAQRPRKMEEVISAIKQLRQNNI
jgi:serine/threonine protein kinase